MRLDPSGDLKIGGVLPGTPNITLNADGTASFAAGSTTIAASGLTSVSRTTASNDCYEAALGNTTNLTIKANGKIVLLGADAGIQFGSTDSGGAVTSQTLDDYEEGTWTPELRIDGSAAGITGTQVGRYTKVGNVVTCNFTITLTSKGSSTGQVSIANLPFSAAGGNENRIM